MDVPDEIVKRMSGVAKDKQAEEGLRICVETIQQLKEVPGVRGFHVMAIEWEEKVPEIVEQSGLYPRPKIEIKIPKELRSNFLSKDHHFTGGFVHG